jgi:D-serine deaminase-like pyridoxal phosphate-dependent protein
MHYQALETPAPIVDLDKMERNLDRMSAYATDHGLALRPHIKTHKSPAVAREQLDRGAVGLTCATPWELAVMSEVAGDLLLAYPVVRAATAEHLRELPSGVRITVATDSAASIELLAAYAARAERAVRVLIEVDLGMHRVGVATAQEALTLARLVRDRPPLEYGGITFYPGHLREPMGAGDARMVELRAALDALLRPLDDAKLTPQIVSGGSTPAAFLTHELPRVTEMRPGTYVYNDRTTAEIEACDWDDCALTVLATVVSTAVPGQAVVDAGTKALGREPVRGAPGEGFGALLEDRAVVVSRMSEEHGILDLSRTSWRPKVGEQVRIVPNHVCIVTHLFDRVYGARGEEIERSWPVAARGRGPTQSDGKF